MNTKEENSCFEEFRDFVKSTREEYEDENFTYTKSFNGIKKLHCETWRYNLEGYDEEEESRRFIELKATYENPNQVLLHLFGYYPAVPERIVAFLEIKSDFSEEISELLNRYPDIENTYPSLKADRFPAPEWLVYPEIPCGSIGWRMGYGEDYLESLMRVPFNGMSFRSSFCEPRNWHFNEKFLDYAGPNLALYSIGWTDKGLPKYELGNENPLRLSDEFASRLINESFRIAHVSYENVEDAFMDSKKSSDERDADWEKLKYSVLLNVLYYKIMEDDYLTETLLKTGDREFSLKTEDSFWADKEEMLVLALMEVRSEINRLFENNDSIDWLYTEFLKIAPYDFQPVAENSLVNRNSAEYMVYEKTYANARMYVRDTNLTERQEKMYERGKIIQERGFVDATSKIGKMTTTHRFAILSNHMADLSEFEEETDWGLHTANANSQFKILDVYTYENKTQILLLHLIDGFEEIFIDDKTIKSEYVEKSRKSFEESFKKEAIESVNGNDWLERCSFPVGLNGDDELWEIQG